MSKKDAVVYGKRACLAVAQWRPEQILRVFYTTEGEYKDLGPLLKACAANKRPYRDVSSEELYKLCKSTHHEGVVVFTHRARKVFLEDVWFEPKNQSETLPIWMAFDGVANDHNLGAGARSLAWFGGSGLIWQGNRPHLSGSALRIAQGGAEQIHKVSVDHLVNSLSWIQDQGGLVIGADQGAKNSLFEWMAQSADLFSKSKGKSRKPTSLCWVLGNEQFGLSKAVKDQCDLLISIPGSGWVESMNVSVSAGILISQSYSLLHSSSAS